MPSITTSRKQLGVSLIEVMVAVLILSFGLLGLASLQMNTLRYNQAAFDRSRAILSVYSIADTLRTQVGTGGSFTLSTATVDAWRTGLSDPERLGDGAQGSVTCNSSTATSALGQTLTNTTCTITVSWRRGSNSATQTLTTAVKL